MASVILTNWTVYYSSDAPAGTSGYKQIKWTGAGTPEAATNTVNELYSALMDLFSISTQNDANDTTPMQAITPTVYNIGTIDQRDQEAWFIDPDSIKHLTGGSIQTVGWTRVVNADVNLGTPGILKVPYTGGTPFVASDIGRAIVNGTATGTLLWYDATAGVAWIRPTSCVSTHDWAGPAGTITVTSGTGSVTQNGAAVSGERLWSNIYSIGTIEANTNLVVYQNFAQVTSFWPAGHIDRLFLVNDGYSTGLIDYGYLTIYARQYTKLYDHYQADASSGGRNPIPLSTSTDINNTTGYRTFVGTSGSGTFNVGNYIYFTNGGALTWATTTKKAVLTAVSTYTLTYYLIGDYTDFVTGNTIKEYDPATAADGDGACTAATPSDVGPLASPSSTVTIVFGGANYDLGNGNGSKPYSVTINCGGATVLQLYERLKYLTRNGQTTDIDTGASQSIVGQQYISIGDYYIPYDTGSIDNPFSETGGENITATSFTSVLTSKHDQGTSEGFIIVRNARGTTPVDNTTLTGGTSGNTALVDTNAGTDPVAAIPSSKTAPFGTFAGGIFFGARGVYIYNMAGASANSYTLIDSEGTTQAPPASIAITVNGVVAGDRVSVFRAEDANGTIAKTYLVSHNINNAAGDTTFEVDVSTPIPTDTPSSGQLRIVNNPNPTEHRLRYVSWTGSIFTLVTTGIPSGTIDSVGDVSGRAFYATNANLANILPGDLVRNTSDGTPGSWAHVTSITLVSGSQYYVTHAALQGGTDNKWDIGDSYSFNNLPITYSNADTAYVPYIDQTATSTSVSTSVTYFTDRNISTQVRKKGIIPFTVNSILLTSSGYTATAVRTTDGIVT